MEILHNVDLASQNTMALPCVADTVIQLHSESDLVSLSASLNGQVPFILGGGSNVILPPRMQRPVIQYLNTDVCYTELNESDVLIEVGAGVNWDTFVEETVDKGLCGLENLSLIPGLVGAAPVQNIGAYGVELENCLANVRAYDFETNKVIDVDKKDCDFDYRDSIFKRSPGRYLILSIQVVLSRYANFQLNYGELAKLKTKTDLSVSDVREAVIKIRKSKLPDPSVLPNTGSFFKNPIVSNAFLNELRQRSPEMVSYPISVSTAKIAAGWLIDNLGWKGVVNNGVSVHSRQALVLVNHGEATQAQVLDLAQLIQKSVKERFSLELEIEPVIILR